MDFVVERSGLLKVLNFVRNAVEKRSTIPILSHFLLEAEGVELRITATDLEITARTSCDARVKAKGAAVVPGLRFLEIVRSAGADEIRCRGVESHSLQVTSGKSSFKLVGLAKADFPKFPTVSGSTTHVEATTLITCVKKTSFAVSEEESRYLLNGALLRLNPDRVTMVATDGHRLALAEHAGQIANLKEEWSVLIPRKALLLLARLAEDAENGAHMEISTDGSHICFILGSRILLSRLLNGQFPNYESVLPKGSGRALDIKPEEFENAVRRVSLLANEHVPGVRLVLEKNRVEVSASSPEYGEAREYVEAHYEQEVLNIGFNARYLLEFLGTVDAATSIRMQVKDAESAAEFRSTGIESAQYRYVLMPLRF